jgi:hypothetical protein
MRATSALTQPRFEIGVWLGLRLCEAPAVASKTLPQPPDPKKRVCQGTSLSKRAMTTLAVIASLFVATLCAPAIAQTDKGPPRIRNVYIPQEDLEAIFGEGNKGALLTRDEFNAMWKKAHGEIPLLPPVDTVATRARYEADLTEHELRIHARIQIVKLQTAWQTLELRFDGVAIESAKIDDTIAQLGRNPDGCLVWVLHEKGRYELSLELSAPVVRTGGDLTAWLQLPPLPSSEFLLHLPEQKQVRVNGVELKSIQEAGGQKTVRIPIDRSGKVPLAMLDTTAGSRRVPLVFANTDLKGTIEPSGLRWQADISLDVAAQAAGQFSLTLPRYVEVASVEATDLGHWTIQEFGEDRWEITIEFRQPFLGQRRVRVNGLAPIAMGDTWAMPAIAVTGAVSHVGEITLQPSAALRLDISEMSAIRRLPIAPATSTAASPVRGVATRAPATTTNQLHFAYWNEQFVLRLRATPRERELSVAVASLIDVARSGLTLRTSLTVEPRYAPLFEIALELPSDWTITALQAAGAPVAWESTAAPAARAGEGANGSAAASQFIRFDLAQPVAPGSTLTIGLTAELHPSKWLEPEGDFGSVPLPEVRLAGANEIEGTIIVESPRDLEMRTSELSADLEPIPPPSGPTTPDVGTVLAYRHQDDAAVNGKIEARIRPAQVSVETLAFASLGRESLAMHYQTDIQVLGGQIRSFEFTLPASAGEKLQITPINLGIRVVEQQHTSLPAQPGDSEELFLWHVVLDRPVTGVLQLAITFEQSRGGSAEGGIGNGTPDDAAGSQQRSGTRTTLPVLSFRNVTRQTGYVAVEAASDQEVEQQFDNLRELDPADLPLPATYQPGRIVAAYQYQRLPFQLRLTGERRDSQEVLAAVCDRATITSLLSREGIMRHQAHYSLRSLGVQHLSVQLPPTGKLWSVMLDGTPVEVRRTGGKYIVPLPAGGPNRAAGQHTVDVIYETRDLSVAASQSTGAAKTEGRSTSDGPKVEPDAASSGTRTAFSGLFPRTIRQVAPTVNMTVLQLTWDVHLPNGTMMVSSDGDFKPTSEPTRPSLIAWLSESIAENSGHDLGLKLTLLGGAVAFGGVVWLLTQSRGMLAGFLVVGTLGILALILVPVVQVARLKARNAPVGNTLKQMGFAIHNYHDEDRSGLTLPSAMPAARAESTFSDVLSARESLAEAAPSREVELEKNIPFRTGAARAGGMGGGMGAGASKADVEGRDSTAGMFPPGTIVEAPAVVDRMARSQPGKRAAPVPPSADYGMQNGATASLAAGAASAPAPATVTPGTTPALNMAPVGGTPQIAPSLRGASLGRLSLTMALDTVGRRGVQFTREGGVGELILHVQDDTLARTLQWVVTIAIAFAAWLIRHRSRSARSALVTACFLFPLGLSGLLPLAWTLVLDGVFVGGIAAVLIWGLAALLSKLASQVTQWNHQVVSTVAGSTAKTVAGLILLFVIAGSANAQTVKGAPNASGAIPQLQAPAAPPVQSPAAQGEIRSSQPMPPRLDSKPLTLYVPYDPKAGNPRDSRWVYIPYDEFQKLWQAANPDKPMEPPPGVTAIVAEAGYEGRLVGDVARFDARLVVYSFQDKWTRVPLPLGTVALEKVDLDGQPATVEEKGDEERPVRGGAADKKTPGADGERLAIYVEKAGLHIVDVRFSVPVARLGATGRVTIPLRPSPSGRLRLELPAPELDVQIEGSKGGWRLEVVKPPVEPPDDREENIEIPGQGTTEPSRVPQRGAAQAPQNNISYVSLPIGGSSEVTIRWQPRRTDAPVSQLISVDQSLLMEIQDSGIHLRGGLHYRVAQGAMRKLQLGVPKGLAVRSITGTDVSDWSLTDRPLDETNRDKPDGEQLLEIALKSEVRTGTDIEFEAFLLGQEPLGPVQLRNLEPIGVARETGRILIGCTSQFHVRIGSTSGVAQIERDGISVPGSGADAACELLSAYRYTARPWALEVVIERLRPRMLVTGRTAVALTRERATIHSVLETAIGDAPIGSLRFLLPNGIRLNRVTVPAGADWFLDRDGDELHLLVELNQPTTGRVPVELIGVITIDSSATSYRVPVVAATDATTQTGQIAIVLDPDLDGRQLASGGARSIAPAELTGSLQPLATASHVFAYRYDSVPDGLTLGISTAGSQLAADLVTTLSVREGSLMYLSELNFDIRGAARSVLQFTTPDWLGSDIDVTGPGVREIRSEAQPAGRRTWTVTLQQAVRGKYQLRLTQSLPLPSDGRVAAAIVEPLEAEPIRSYVILENRASAQLTEVASRGVSAIQTVDVPLALTDELRRRAISAHKVLDGQATLAWQREEREQEKAIPANINLADLVTVIHRDGTYRTQAAYVVTNRTQQFLEIGLPANSQLWAVYVAGQPVRPATTRRGNRDVTLVPLQKVSVGSISAQVVIVYSGSLGGKIGRWTRLTPQAPDILGGVPVARTLWTVYTPNDFVTDVVERTSNMTPIAVGDVVVARDLAFLEEMNELVKVCKFSQSRNANMMACNNLQQLSNALRGFQRPATSAAPQTVDNRQTWRAADTTNISQQLEVFLCPSDGLNGVVQVGEIKGKDNWDLVQQRARELQTEIGAIVRNKVTVTPLQLEADVSFERYFSESKSGDADRAAGRKLLGAMEQDGMAMSGLAKGDARDEKETRRGKMREQNFANVDKLKEEQSQSWAFQNAEQSSLNSALGMAQSRATGKDALALRQDATTRQRLATELNDMLSNTAGGEIAGGEPFVNAMGGGQTGQVNAKAGIQSIAIEIPLVGKPQHYMRLLGDPKLTLSARHEDVTRWSGSAAWAVLCLALGGILAVTLARSQTTAWLANQWPWLGVAAGIAWLFLLPAGPVGLVVLIIGASALAWRTRNARPARAT